jgi:hypothetical protein
LSSFAGSKRIESVDMPATEHAIPVTISLFGTFVRQIVEGRGCFGIDDVSPPCLSLRKTPVAGCRGKISRGVDAIERNFAVVELFVMLE